MPDPMNKFDFLTNEKRKNELTNYHEEDKNEIFSLKLKPNSLCIIEIKNQFP